jgi:2-iminoacetate synthase
MDLAKPGAIRHHCDPNAVSTLMEYLMDYASPQTRVVGDACIADQLPRMDEVARKRTQAMVAQVQAGKRDVFC